MENELSVFVKWDQLYTDSRDVAKMIDKRHDHLIRDIDGYVDIIGHSPKMGASNFFV